MVRRLLPIALLFCTAAAAFGGSARLPLDPAVLAGAEVFTAAEEHVAAAAQTATLPDVPDTDENGTWSLVELQAVWTDLTEEGFAGIDLNVDGQVDATELQTALDNGVITLPAAETEASGG